MNNAPSLVNDLNPLIKEGDIRLNLGGRDTKIDGFLTVDLKEGSEITANCSDLKDKIKDSSVREIYASNILEHFPHTKTISVLKEWRRVLIPNGKLWISVPDFDSMIKLYQKEGMTDFIRNLLYGDQLYDLAFHYTGFTFATLAHSALKAGFSDIKRINWLPYNVNDCSRNIDNKTFKSVMINAEVTA